MKLRLARILSAAFALAVFCLALAGCSGSSGSTQQGASAGFASDTEVPQGKVNIAAYVDERLIFVRAADGGTLLEDAVARYQGNTDRDQVTFSFTYVSPEKLRSIALKGAQDADMIIGLDSVLKEGSAAGTVYGGQADTSIRLLTCMNTSRLVLAQSASGTAQMPRANTDTGEDSADATVNRLQNMGKFKGTIYIPAEDTLEGQLANKALYTAGLYSAEEGTGGSYDKAIQDKVQVCASSDEVAEALESDEGGLGFLFSGDIAAYYSNLQTTYEVPAGGGPQFSGASLTASASGGVARDFLQFLAMIA